jgi:PadR family transcriptional regulator, regulatory protein PadR
MVAPKSELPQGTLDLLILRIVTQGPKHGYAIAQKIQQASREALQVRQGSLYPALHRLEYKKLLAAGWAESESGRRSFTGSRLPVELASKAKRKAGPD